MTFSQDLLPVNCIHRANIKVIQLWQQFPRIRVYGISFLWKTHFNGVLCRRFIVFFKYELYGLMSKFIFYYLSYRVNVFVPSCIQFDRSFHPALAPFLLCFFSKTSIFICILVYDRKMSNKSITALNHRWVFVFFVCPAFKKHNHTGFHLLSWELYL